jgi:hypothetical protein
MGANIAVDTGTTYAEPQVAVNFQQEMARGMQDSAPTEQAYYIMDDYGNIRLNDFTEEKSLSQLIEEADWEL